MNKTKNIRKSLKLLALIVYASLSISIFSITSFGMVAGTQWNYGVIAGVNYFNINYMTKNTANTSIFGITMNGKPNSSDPNIPAYWAGANSRLYNSAGTMVEQSAWQYNDTVIYSGSLVVLTPTYSKKGTYYTKGYTRCYTTDPNAIYSANGRKYYQHGTYATPNLTL